MPRRVKLPQFNPDALCPKCSYDEIRTIYHENDHGVYGCPLAETEWTDYTCEHLQRVCQRCKFVWVEGCAAAAKETP